MRRFDSSMKLLLATHFLLFGCSDPEPPRALALPCTKCNLILISADTVRADRLSLYGYERPTTPFLDALANESVVFENFLHSGGGTLPSHATMFTGLYPLNHGIDFNTDRSLEDARETLSEILLDNGYRTAAFTDAGWMRRGLGLEQGFELYDDRDLADRPRKEKAGFESSIEPALSWIDESPDEAFFLFLHSYDAHSKDRVWPYECGEPYDSLFAHHPNLTFDGCRDENCASAALSDANRRIRSGEIEPDATFSESELKWMSDLYDGCIRFVDDQLRDFVRELKERDMLKNTIFVVTSDHGEEFLEHGLLLHAQLGYSEITNIPLLIRFPNGTGAGRRPTQLATMVDLMPTLLSALGLETPDAVQGVSLLPALESSDPLRKEIHIFHRAIRTPDWVYRTYPESLYDARADPDQNVNLIDSPEHRATVARLRKRLIKLANRDRNLGEAFLESNDKAGRELSEERKVELRALGYAQ